MTVRSLSETFAAWADEMESIYRYSLDQTFECREYLYFPFHLPMQQMLRSSQVVPK